ncbi:MAG: hypothetical protein HZC40_09820 [Chloroflexi bacterium]|nr:hypothetical protein [Chloroflexota bacterium]
MENPESFAAVENNAVEKNDDRFQTVIAILMALVTVIGAVVVWRASVAADAAGDADFAGLRAMTNVEETRALNFVNAYENYGAFTAYLRHDQLGEMMVKDQAGKGEDANVIEQQRLEAHDLAIANQHLFPNRFLNRDGTYALQRQLGEMWADAAREKDLNPEPQFDDAEKLRGKTLGLLGMVVLLSFGLVSFTVVEVMRGCLRYAPLALGAVLTFVGTAGTILIELVIR